MPLLDPSFLVGVPHQRDNLLRLVKKTNLKQKKIENFLADGAISLLDFRPTEFDGAAGWRGRDGKVI